MLSIEKRLDNLLCGGVDAFGDELLVAKATNWVASSDFQFYLFNGTRESALLELMP